MDTTENPRTIEDLVRDLSNLSEDSDVDKKIDHVNVMGVDFYQVELNEELLVRITNDRGLVEIRFNPRHEKSREASGNAKHLLMENSYDGLQMVLMGEELYRFESMNPLHVLRDFFYGFARENGLQFEEVSNFQKNTLQYRVFGDDKEANFSIYGETIRTTGNLKKEFVRYLSEHRHELKREDLKIFLKGVIFEDSESEFRRLQF